jgi:hypothetical protein
MLAPFNHVGCRIYKTYKHVRKMEKEIIQNIWVVLLWHEALNMKHKRGLAELVTKNVKMSGPKGDVEGVNIMLEWMDRANITLEPKRYFQSGEIIIVEELAVWQEGGTEKEINSAKAASVFVLDDGRIASIQRFDNLNKAFEATGLNERNQVELK